MCIWISVDVEDLYLLEIASLNEKYGEKIKGIGFSGHHTGIAADISALTIGAKYIERHFTLDRTWKGMIMQPVLSLMG